MQIQFCICANIINKFENRTHLIASSYTIFNNELKNVKQASIKNKFPNRIIVKQIKLTLKTDKE